MSAYLFYFSLVVCSCRDYKLNVRLFDKWVSIDRDVMRHSKALMSLPLTSTPSKRKRVGRGRKKTSGKGNADSSTSEPEAIKRFEVEDEFTDDSMPFDICDPDEGDTTPDDDDDEDDMSEEL